MKNNPYGNSGSEVAGILSVNADYQLRLNQCNLKLLIKKY